MRRNSIPSRQCVLLHIQRSKVYYKPAERSVDEQLRRESIMARIDHWHTQMPGIGTRKLVRQLKNEGFSVGRKLVRRLMGEMGIQAIYPKANLSKRNLRETIVPYLLRNKAVFLPNQVWSIDITYIKMQHSHMYLTAIIVVQPHDCRLEPVRHPGHRLCDSGGQGRRGSAWDACNSKLRSGLSVYQQRLQNAVEGASHPAEYGRKVPVGGQRDD